MHLPLPLQLSGNGRGGALSVSFQLLCVSIGLLVYLLVACSIPPLLSLSIRASDAVVQAAGRAALQTLTLSAWVRRAGGLED